MKSQNTPSAGDFDPGLSFPDEPTEDPNAAIRAEILDVQRREWKATRALVWGLMQSVRDDKDGRKAPLEERLEVARVLPRALQIIHDGERRTWGLDADLIDYESLTDAQLDAVAAGRMPR